MRAVHVWLRSTDLLRFDTCNNEKNYENHMHDDRGPQKWSDGSAANANPDEIQRDKNAVGQHSVELLTARHSTRPAGNCQANQRNAGDATDDDAESIDLEAKQRLHRDRGVDENQ